ncbi:hypothetical protein ATCC90586_002938 [Pythium insidiosum]|nr:hypothetical protein ATCC90586_002938 [Pythium insidiosum]
MRVLLRALPSAPLSARALGVSPSTRPAVAAAAVLRRATSAPLTTYSGGQPYDGQGGFYGAIKSRSEKNAVFQPGSRAEPSDVDALQRLMDHWDAERAVLRNDSEERAAWRELVQDATHRELLTRLVVKGAPVWGLTVEQREFVARFQATRD